MQVNKKIIYVWIVLSLTMTSVTLFQAVMLHQADNGDLNHDGKVNIKDVSILSTHWTKKK